jgi:hypothetical protein
MLPGLLRDATAEWCEAHDIEDHRARQVFEAVYGGFDREAGRARLFAAYNYEGFVPQELPAGAGCGVIPTLPPELRPDIDGLPPRKRMLRGLRAAARYVASDPARAKGAVIGGECEMTTVRASGISTVTIGFLPVAAPDPAAAQSDDDPLAGLTLVSEMRVAQAQPAPRVSRPARRGGLFAVGAGFGAGALLNSLVGGNKLYGTAGSGVGSLTGTLATAALGLGPTGVLLGGIGGGPIGSLAGNPFKTEGTR